MTFAAFCVLWALAAPLFDASEIPLANPASAIFVAPGDTDGAAAVFVLSGETLDVYSSKRLSPLFSVSFEPGTTAFDLMDIDGDGLPEMIAVCGDRILGYGIEAADLGAPPRELFRLRTQLADVAPGMAGHPFAHVMLMKRQGRFLLALPCRDTFELRLLDGTLSSSYPTGPDAPRRVSYGRPFSAVSVEPPRIGRRDAFEAQVSRVLQYEPELPRGFLPEPLQLPLHRHGTPGQIRDAARLGDASWSWFPLRTTGGTAHRVLYAAAPPDYRDTLVRLREASGAVPSLKDEGVRLSPERRYSGVLLVPEGDLPDFDGDGNVDLLLWRTREPGTSVDSLARSVVAGSWPIMVVAHLFSPDKQRYEPKPFASVETEIPVAWFLWTGPDGPLRFVSIRDFNGDGRTDLGCATAPDTYAVWLCDEDGFGRSPDFDRSFPSPLVSIEFASILDESRATSLGFRTETSFHLWRARSVASDE